MKGEPVYPRRVCELRWTLAIGAEVAWSSYPLTVQGCLSQGISYIRLWAGMPKVPGLQSKQVWGHRAHGSVEQRSSCAPDLAEAPGSPVCGHFFIPGLRETWGSLTVGESKVWPLSGSAATPRCSWEGSYPSSFFSCASSSAAYIEARFGVSLGLCDPPGVHLLP